MDTRVFDFSIIGDVWLDLLAFLDVTLVVAGLSILLGTMWGMVLAYAKLRGNVISQGLAGIYTYAMRCTPSIVLLFIVFYGLPALTRALFHYNINDWHRGVFAVITFSLLFGAYMSEVFRAAYLAVPKGQYEAAVSIGLAPWQAVWHITLPQAAKIALPNFGNGVINLLKEGSLAYTIGLIDMLGKGNMIIAQNYGAYGVEIYLACIVVYWLMTLLLERLFAKWERHLSKGQKQHQAMGRLQVLWQKLKWRRSAEHGLEY